MQNDPVNLRDLWGLSAADSSAKSKSGPVLDMSTSGIRNPYEGVLPTIPFSSLSENNQEKIKTLNSALWKDATNMMYQLQTNSILVEAGVTVEIVCAVRDLNEQQKMYNQGRTTPGPIISWAKPGQSYHNFGLAFDVELYNAEGQKFWKSPGVPDTFWDITIQIGIDNGFEAGATWTNNYDAPHFENSTGKTLKELRKEYGIE